MGGTANSTPLIEGRSRPGAGRGYAAIFAQIVGAMPKHETPENKAAPAPQGVNPRGLLPGSLRYEAYAGSLTTPTPT